MKISVLGTEYTVYKRSKLEDKSLEQCDGYCDKSTHEIVVCVKESDCEIGDFESYQKKCLRHEIIHAFLFESGLHENWKHDTFGHDESYVDWIAAQFPKLQKAFKDADCL